MCSLAAHPPMNKWHIIHTFPVFHSHCLFRTQYQFVQWTHCVTPANQTSYHYVKMKHDGVSLPECRAMKARRHGRKTPLTKFVVITMVLVKIPVFYSMVPCWLVDCRQASLLASSSDLTAILWRDKCEVRVLTNIHDPLAEGNFCDNNEKAIKPQIVANYNRHMGYVDKGHRMTETYSINNCTWKWTKKLFFHLFDLAILNSYILFSSLGGKKISLRDFWMTLMRN